MALTNACLNGMNVTTSMFTDKGKNMFKTCDRFCHSPLALKEFSKSNILAKLHFEFDAELWKLLKHLSENLRSTSHKGDKVQ